MCPTTLSRRVFGSGVATANQRPVVMLLLVLAVASLAAYGAWRLLADIGG